MGGEEFLVLLPDTDERAAAAVAEDLRASVEEARVRCNGRELRTTVSVGWATWAGDESPDRLVKRADVALYAAKNAGRNAVRAAENGSAASLPRRT
jgi:diguanylate cyclase (GGDEF)-like protein